MPFLDHKPLILFSYPMHLRKKGSSKQNKLPDLSQSKKENHRINKPESRSGLSIKSNSSISKPKHFNCKKLDVKLHRRISGSEESDIELKASSVYKRKQKPLPYAKLKGRCSRLIRNKRTSRPARPARCIADDLLISRTNNVSKPTNFESQT